MFFYKTLKHHIQNNLIYKTIPLYYDQANTSIPHYLYFPYDSQFTQEQTLIDFAKFYLKSYFQTSQELSFEQICELSISIKFKKSFKEETIKKYNLVQSKDVPNVESDNLVLPCISYHPIRYPSVLDGFNVERTIDAPNGIKLFNSVYSNIIEQFLTKTLDQTIRSVEGPQTIPPIIQKHVVFGNDVFLNHFLLALCVEISKNFFSHSFLTHSIVFIPSNENTSVGKFLSSICPVYSFLVNSCYSVISGICPTHDEKSSVAFTPIELKSYENNIWFCDPSPSSIIQSSIAQLVLLC